jgi:hypothetical protein
MSAEKHHHIHKNRWEIFINNFTGGIAWGLGASVGVSVLFTVLGYIASQANLVPFIGSFVSQVIDFVLKHNQNLQKPPPY